MIMLLLAFVIWCFDCTISTTREAQKKGHGNGNGDTQICLICSFDLDGMEIEEKRFRPNTNLWKGS